MFCSLKTLPTLTRSNNLGSNSENNFLYWGLIHITLLFCFTVRDFLQIQVKVRANRHSKDSSFPFINWWVIALHYTLNASVTETLSICFISKYFFSSGVFSSSQTSGCSYYGLLEYLNLTGSDSALQIMRPVKDWNTATLIQLDMYLLGFWKW